MEKELFETNIKFALKIASKYVNYACEMEDLKQEALLGLWNAAKTFKSGRAEFQTYAYRCITNSINQYLYKFKRIVPPISSQITYLDSEDTLDLENMLSDEGASIYQIESGIFVEQVLFNIRGKTQKTIIEQIAKGYSVSDIAKSLSCSVQNISNLKVRALQKLKKGG